MVAVLIMGSIGAVLGQTMFDIRLMTFISVLIGFAWAINTSSKYNVGTAEPAYSGSSAQTVD